MTIVRIEILFSKKKNQKILFSLYSLRNWQRGGKRGETRYWPVQQVVMHHTWKMIDGDPRRNSTPRISEEDSFPLYIFHAIESICIEGCINIYIYMYMCVFIYLFIYEARSNKLKHRHQSRLLVFAFLHFLLLLFFPPRKFV